MIKAIFFDCDGTLLSHHTNRVPDHTVEAFDLLKKQGIKRILSTGRHRSELKELTQLKDLSFEAYITVNGACTYDATGVIDARPISEKTKKTVYEYLQTHKLPIQFFLEEDTFISCVNETVIRSQEGIHTPVPPLGDLRRILEESVYLMVPFGIKEAEELIDMLEDVQVTRWNAHDAVDLVSLDAGKHNGMAAICRKYGIQVDETMAFGDAMNDADMLRHAGISVAMGNGDAELKELADYVCGDIDEDGLYEALMHFGLLGGEQA